MITFFTFTVMNTNNKILLALVFLLVIYNNISWAETSTYTSPLEVDYIENKGQWPHQVLFRADLSGGFVYLEDKKITYMFFDRDWHKHGHDTENGKYTLQGDTKMPNPNYEDVHDNIVKGHVYTTEYLGGNMKSIVTKEQPSSYYFNYFIGNDPSKWASNVLAYKTITYSNVYEGIDVKISSVGASMKTDYVLNPLANASKIRIKYNGINSMYLDSDGNLILKTSINDIKEFKPFAYQNINGEQREVKTKYILENNVVGFEILEQYDHSIPLVIDPTLVFSTYSGSTVDNWGSSATYDNAGNMYLGGIALGPNYPTMVGSFQTNFGGGGGLLGTDVVITKFRANGSSRIFSTYLGGIDNELLSSLYNSADNKVVALIVTGSNNFPVSGSAYDRSFNGGYTQSAMGGSIDFYYGTDIAITRLETNGNALVGSTYFGGSGNDGLNEDPNILFNYGDETRGDLEILSDNSIMISSTTDSRNIPGTSGKSQPTYGGGNSDGVLAKFNSNLSSLEWATYYGGSGADAAYYIEVDGSNNIFITGGTTSNNLANRNLGLNTAYSGGRSDGYIAKLNANTSNVLVSTYLGTTSYDQSFIISLDKSNNVIAYGSTLGSYPTTSGVYKNTNARQFFHKLNNNLNTTIFSTTFGNPNDEYTNLVPTSLLIDICGNIYAAGWGGGPNASFERDAGYTRGMPITSDAFKSQTDQDDFYFISLNSEATTLLYGSYFGENGAHDHVDGGTSKFDKNGIIYQAVCASCGGSDNFPTTQGAYSRVNRSSNCNMAGVKFQFDLKAMQITSINATPNPVCLGNATSFSFTSSVKPTSILWNFGDGDTSTRALPDHVYAASGTYTVKLVIQKPDDCNPLDSAIFSVIVIRSGSFTVDSNICQGQSVTIGDQSFSQSGTYTIHFNSGTSCDSIVTLRLNVKPNSTYTYSREICQGDTVMANGQSYSATGIYTFHLASHNGCDSFVTLNLVVNPTPLVNISQSICYGKSVTIGNQTFSQSGTYTIHLNTDKGCDSIIILQLQVKEKLETQISQSICEGDSLFFFNSYYKNSGIYSQIVTSSTGCDSTIVLILSVTPKAYAFLYKEICVGSSIVIGGQTYHESGTYIITLQTVSGCDSILTLRLLATNLIHDTTSFTVCEGDSVLVNGGIYKEEGRHQTHVITQTGCDTLLTFDLYLLAKDTVWKEISICDGDSVLIENNYYKEEGTFTFLHLNQVGCDSTTYILLKVLPTSQYSIEDSICSGDTLYIGQQIFTSTGQYQITLENQYGCDSILDLTLFVEPQLNISISADSTVVMYGSQVGLQLSPSSQVYEYSWLPQRGLSSYSTSNTVATIIEDITYYGSIMTPLGCTTTDSITIYLKDCKAENVYLPNAFSPNGDHNHDVYYVVSAFELIDFHLMIFDRWGEKVFESYNKEVGWDGTLKGKPAAADSYAYVFEGRCSDITIKKQGNITLIR